MAVVRKLSCQIMCRLILTNGCYGKQFNPITNHLLGMKSSCLNHVMEVFIIRPSLLCQIGILRSRSLRAEPAYWGSPI